MNKYIEITINSDDNIEQINSLTNNDSFGDSKIIEKKTSRQNNIWIQNTKRENDNKKINVVRHRNNEKNKNNLINEKLKNIYDNNSIVSSSENSGLSESDILF